MLDVIFFIAILIFSVIVHEVAHGWVALALGDPTAKDAGRLTLNPIPHIDLLGSIIIPTILVLTASSFLFGWAKPVPYNPYNVKYGKWGEALVALGGPGINIFMAIVFAMLIRFGLYADAAMFQIFSFIVFINLFLAAINLIPFPPLDGSKIVAPFIPFHVRRKLAEKFSFIFSNVYLLLAFAFIVIFSLVNYIAMLVAWLAATLTGAGI